MQVRRETIININIYFLYAALKLWLGGRNTVVNRIPQYNGLRIQRRGQGRKYGNKKKKL